MECENRFQCLINERFSVLMFYEAAKKQKSTLHKGVLPGIIKAVRFSAIEPEKSPGFGRFR